MKNFQRLLRKLADTRESFDKEITVFNSLPVDKDDINYKLCVKSTRIETDDHFLETDDLKKGAATKVLFVRGKQATSQDLRACIANMMCELQAMFTNAEQSNLYKMFHEYLKFLVRSPARSWLDGE